MTPLATFAQLVRVLRWLGAAVVVLGVLALASWLLRGAA